MTYEARGSVCVCVCGGGGYITLQLFAFHDCQERSLNPVG